jgi:hypothetical protein
MRNTIVFTSTLSPKIMDWLNTYSKQEKITKREIIERSVLFYKETMIRNKMAASFKLAAKDPEVLEMAELGIADYCDQLNQ